MALAGLAPASSLLLAGLVLDALFGDPQFRFHPIRLIGRTLSVYEQFLRRKHWDGYGGGCLLFLMLVLTWVVLPSFLVVLTGAVLHVLIVYVSFALRDLIDHVRAVQHAAQQGELTEARTSIGRLAGRDTDKMDFNACRRAAI